jgi:hypothetical protein
MDSKAAEKKVPQAAAVLQVTIKMKQVLRKDTTSGRNPINQYEILTKTTVSNMKPGNWILR